MDTGDVDLSLMLVIKYVQYVIKLLFRECNDIIAV